MITYVLILAILLVGIVCKGATRTPVLIFIVPAALFQIISAAGLMPGDYFHLTAGIFDLAVICMLISWTKPGFMPLFIGVVSVISIFANALGWIAYENGTASIVYDWTYVALYALVLGIASTEWLDRAGAGLSNMHVRGSRN